MKENIDYQMGITRHLTKVFWIVALVAILGLGYYLGTKAINTMAVTGCMQAGRLERTNDKGETVLIPEDYWYQRCLSEATK